MPDRPSICVFCGSQVGARPAYADAARRVGTAIARRGIELVYGGGRVGLMGIVADAALAAGGRVVGVIPEPIATKEVAHSGLHELIVVPGMHERKAVMARRSSAFLMLPGGVGTLEEFFEVLTWSVLGLHRKPLGLLDVEGYFLPLLAFLDHAVAEEFVRPDDARRIVIVDDPETIEDQLLRDVPPPPRARWIAEDQT